MNTSRLYLSTIFVVMFFGIFLVQPVFAEKEVQLFIKYNEDTVHSLSASDTDDSSIKTIKVPQSEVEAKLEELREEEYIKYAEIDAPVYTQALSTPNDPKYMDQQSAFDVMKVAEAWGKYEPKQEVTVAVIDSGIDLDHPDLSPFIIEGKNILKPHEQPIDHNGHGTHIAGLVGAATDNGIGVSSVSRGVKIMPIKVLEQNEGMISSVISGIEYAMQQDVDVINVSLGSYINSLALRDTVQEAAEKGIVIVAAAGNHNRNDAMYPAKYPEVISVGSIDTSTHEKADFSNYGTYIDVATPGTNVVSTWMDGDYKPLEGTSMSAGIVTSLASMILQQSPYLTNTQVKDIIQKSTSEVSSSYSLGTGMIDASNSLDKIYSNNRLYGPNSVETAVEVSKFGWSQLEHNSITVDDKEIKGKIAVLATGDTFADSLAASPLGTYLNSPILLVKNSTLTAEVKAELERLGATHVAIIGGKQAVSSEIESELTGLGYKIARIFGQTRYETSIAVNKAVGYTTNKAFIVSGEVHPDALSIAPYSGIKQYPILFVKQNSIDPAVLDYMREAGITKSYIIGGEAPISSEVEKMLPAPYRIAGKDRYGTNFAVHDIFGEDDASSLFFATGENYPDSLSVAPLAAQTKSPVILVPPAIVEKTKESISLFSLRNRYHIIGGKAAIDVETGWELDRYVN
ncbi:cell wall-binding repeat-containing protein [Rossellomorea aquimaris]|uniref:S8 family serine peptidase n=1 Tax=Rossellomorea aquimaris TaxID=189382 RepID=A0A5D4TJH7_9BACI|nr:cell wall-binding repeat-containing protein [Rossellomorea aquimaris]TYS75817.1 S8 family serine peptidase [Rossellomorea aquimaris]